VISIGKSIGARVFAAAHSAPFPSVFATAQALPHHLTYLVVAILGLLFGSFLNVCIARLPRHESIAWPGSHCPRCGAPIRPWDNVPLVSFMLLRGRCRACGEPIALRYPLVESATAALFLACLARFGVGVWMAEAAVACFLLLGLLVMDLETLLLPNAFTLTGIALGVLQTLLPGRGLAAGLRLLDAAPFAVPLAGRPAWQSSLAAGAGAAMLLLLVRWSYWILRRRHGMGLGDVKLGAMLGCWLGGAGVGLTLFVGIVLGALIGIFITTLRRSRAGDQGLLMAFNPTEAALRLPLGTFLCAAGLITIFFGVPLLKFYFSFWP
jgi:leader peptidase (prepilin peptidase)/N-methyltransferase